MNTILHATDLSEGSRLAYAHALILAVLYGARLHLLHVADPGEPDPPEFPSVRGTLVRWGLLEAGSPRAAVADELSVAVKKVVLRSSDPHAAVAEYADRHEADLLVLATGARRGLSRVVRPSVAEAMARDLRIPTLFVRKGGRGFVTPSDGRIQLRRMVVPVAHRPDPAVALEAAARLARRMDARDLGATVLHVANGGAPPGVAIPDNVPGTWLLAQRGGGVVEQILSTVEEVEADLVVMATEGHQGVRDAVQGSDAERVVRRVPCPILTVPAFS